MIAPNTGLRSRWGSMIKGFRDLNEDEIGAVQIYLNRLGKPLVNT